MLTVNPDDQSVVLHATCQTGDTQDTAVAKYCCSCRSERLLFMVLRTGKQVRRDERARRYCMKCLQRTYPWVTRDMLQTLGVK